MGNQSILLAGLFVAVTALAVLVIILMIKISRGGAGGIGNEAELRCEIREEMRRSRQEMSKTVQLSVRQMGEMIAQNQRESTENQSRRLAELNRQLASTSMGIEQRLENIRISMEKKITMMTDENNRQLSEMRNTVDEKLQKTLEDRIGRSFRQVSDTLEQVTRGLGQMQTLAAGVGDLKKVLSNVKTRGIVGEIQLGAILAQILSPEQYDENVAVKGGSERVEFAVKFPGEGDRPVYLPIDSKFPADAYTRLLDAYDTGDRQLIKAATDGLRNAVLKAAKDIRTKYISPPYTTEFAIMFLPFEGLYAEVLRLGLVDTLQRDYRINIAGPTTMAAMLNSFQMGFRSLALQKQSGEVWDTLAKVRTEFDKFGDVLVKTQTKMEQAQKDLEKLVGVRTRGIQRALKGVATVGEPEETGDSRQDTLKFFE
ncbi:RmuC family [uncultured Eubacterium sp.]|uniref:DNA recombination protein RmuC n=1 Tax=Brotomerdimonas butyrica TaxID=2981721 RepID=UPI0008234A62|nr:DNA recombination protein RmuC [Brotomerdimonas butyrica]MCU6754767.1 DNA recombination protein RmuC [Brotomerdimonas butyrica]SCG92739.1 RmuC family [uncultured Eubacterium sp.]